MSESNTHVLKLPGYRHLWVGQLISQFGDVLHFMVFLWWAGEIGGPRAAAIVATCSMLTYIMLSMVAGTVADRVDRRLILLMSDLVCGCVVVAMAITAFNYPKPPLWVLCIFTSLLKMGFVFQAPARSAAVGRLVPQDRLLEANSLNSTVQTAMPLAGNALGAILLGIIFKISASLAYIVAFGINAVSFFVSAIFMAKLPAIVPFREEEKHPFQDAVDGVKYIWTHPVIRISTLMMIGFGFCAAPFMQGYIQVAQTTYKHGVEFAGLNITGPALLSLLETGFFVGYVIGSLLLHKRPMRKVGVAFSVAMAVGSAMIIPMGYVSSWVLFWVLNLLSGIVWPFALVTIESFVQATTPDEFRGRVHSGSQMMATMAAAIGVYFAGHVLDAWGAGGLFAVIGSGLVLFALLGLAFKPFREAEMPVAAQKASEPTESMLSEPA